MYVDVLLVGTQYSDRPLTRLDLLFALRRASPRGYYATKSYIWTKENLFSALASDPVDAQNKKVGSLRASINVGDNEGDLHVLVLLLHDLTRAVQGLVARVLLSLKVKCDPRHDSCGFEEKQDDFILLQLAETIEASAKCRKHYLRRWGVTELNYDRALVGRVWLFDGVVHVIPANAAAALEAGSGDLPSTAALQPFAEPELTLALRRWLTDVIEPAMRHKSLHTCVAAVPPKVALLLHRLPRGFLHECVLFHCVDRPLASCGDGGKRGGAVADSGVTVLPSVGDSAAWSIEELSEPNAAAGANDRRVHTRCRALTRDERLQVAAEESSRLANVLLDYDILLSNERYARVPVFQVPRYLFACLVCSDLPSSLLLPLVRAHPNATAASSDHSNSFPRPTEEEILIGIRLTWALQRWQRHLTNSLPRERQQLKYCSAAVQKLQIRRSLLRDLADSCEAALDSRRALLSRRAEHGTQDLTVSDNTDATEKKSPDGGLSPAAADMRALEAELFAPHAATYRGDSSRWIMDSVRELQREYCTSDSIDQPDEAHDVCTSERTAARVGSSEGSAEHLLTHLSHHSVRAQREDDDGSSSNSNSCATDDQDAASRSASTERTQEDDALTNEVELLNDMQKVEAHFSRELQLLRNSSQREDAEAVNSVLSNEMMLQTMKLFGHDLSHAGEP